MAKRTGARVDAAQRDAAALELRADGASFREIADRLDVSVSTAWECVDRGLAATRQEPSSKLRALERERLDRLTVQAVQVLQAPHVAVSGGKIVRGDDGQPLVDHGPTLAAINTLTRLMERRARMEGLDEPARADITAKVHAEVYSVDALDRELERVTQQLAEQDPDWAETERRQRQRAQALDRFRAVWSTPGQVARDPARFVGDGLALLLDGLDLDDPSRESAAAEVERLLWTQADR
jgi:hypothetical protein